MFLLRKARLLLALRFVMGDYKTTSSVKSMLEHLKWPTLEERRKRAKVTMLYRYRIIHQVVIIPAPLVLGSIAP
jgi:hypothetical protein